MTGYKCSFDSVSLRMRVVIGWRPAGSWFKMETSRSPKTVSWSERGIGVAVMARRCGARPGGDLRASF